MIPATSTMKFNLSHAVGRVRFCGLFEGISFLLLLLVAVPLKRVFKHELGEPAVFYVGSVHGALFILYLLLILLAWLDRKLTVKKAGLAFIASVIPFGPFLIDRKLAEDEKESGSAA